MLAAVTAAGWAAAFLIPDLRAAAVTVPLYALAGLLCRREPLTAGALVAAAELAQALLGVNQENPASTLAVLLTTFWAGGIVLVSPQKESGSGGCVPPVVRTANSQSE